MDNLARISIEVLTLILVYIVGELVSHYVIFRILNRRYIKKESGAKERSNPGAAPGQKSRAQEKGHFERGMLALGLAAGFPQILIVFGALKIGTFFKGDNSEKVTSDYYLIGNVVSISIVILYVLVWKAIVSNIEWN